VTLVVVCSVILAAVLATAGIAKLRDRAGTRDAIARFGVPASLAAPLALAVPVAELSAALALVAGPTRAWGAFGALVLLVGFSLALAWNLARGRTPDCHCFGQLHSSPVGPRTLARNAALIAVAGLVAGNADPAATAIAAAGGIAIVPVGWALSRRAALAAGSGPGDLAVGTPAPSFALPSLDGSTVSMRSLLTRGRPTLLVFSDPHCGPCQELAPDVAEWQRLYAEELTVAVVERRDGSRTNREDEHGRRTVLLQSETEIADAFGARGTPSAVLVGVDGRVASPVAGGSAAIEELVGANVARFEPHPTEVAGGSAWTVPVRLGGPLIRRELLVRGAGTAAAGTVLARPLRALGLASGGKNPKCEKDKDCPRRSVCRGGRCACPGGHEPDRCRGDCTNFDVDEDHCGGCGKKRCGPGEKCYGGRCVPFTGDGTTCAEDCGSMTQVCCQGRCRGLGFDSEHCGGCGISCPPGQTCCWGRCTDPRRDPRYCGGTSSCVEGEKCFPDQVCHNNKCRDECPEPLRQCGGTCGNPNTQICCGKQTLIDKEDVENGVLKCCDGEAVAPLPDGRCPRFCQGQPYDPQVYQCCEEGLRPWDDSSFFCP
jgi:thiol-disulfide isomerase/thioredoxin